MDNLNNMTQMAKNLARAITSNKIKYNDEQILTSSTIKNLQNENDDEQMEELSDLEIAVRNVIFGLRGLSNFTQNKSEAEQLLYNFLNAFNSNYVVDDSDLPEGLSSETKLIFAVRFIEAILSLLSMNLTEPQNNLLVDLMHFGLNVITEIANSL